MQGASHASDLRVNQRVALGEVQATHPLQLVHLDYLTMEVTEDGKDLHMLINHCWSFYEVGTSPGNIITDCSVYNTSYMGLICSPYGVPESIISDQVQNFESYLIAELCKLAKVWKLLTRGQCEWFNHTLINMLCTLPPNKKSSWRDMALTHVHAYNCTSSTAKGFSPYYLMYGQRPH